MSVKWGKYKKHAHETRSLPEVVREYEEIAESHISIAV